jgi:hypothetical protein
VRLAIVMTLVALAATAPLAAGKGLDLTLETDPGSPAVGERVEVTLRGVADEALTQPCRGMRIVVVAPGVSVTRALRSLEGGVESRRIGRWDAFRLASLRSVGELRWTGRLRPNRPGRWTLVVPNWCAQGYVLPQGATRHHFDVR